MQGIISVNGVISNADDAKIPATDRGFLFGDSVFETFVGFQDQILDVDAHLARLRNSADELAIEIPWSDAELKREILEAASSLRANKKNVRLVVTRGNGMGLQISQGMTPNRFVFVFPAKVEPQQLYEHGIKLKSKRLSYTERGPSAKTGNYLNSILALRGAQKEGYDDVLWMNSSGELTEASTANIFLLGRDGDLVEVATPAINSGILAGITRARLIEILSLAKIPVTERIVFADELARFDEAFICSTVRGLVPVVQIDQHKLHSARPNAIFRQIERLFFASITRDLGYAVNWNTGEKKDDDHPSKKTDRNSMN